MTAARTRWWFVGGISLVPLAGSVVALTFAKQSTGPIGRDLSFAKRTAKPAVAAPLKDGHFIAAHGVVEPMQPEMRLTADVPGRISRVVVNEGDHVKAGTTLAEVENSSQKAEVAAADAAFAEAQASLEQTLHGMRSQDLSASVSESIAARARAGLAQSELERAKQLVSSGSIAPAELDDVRHKYDAARAEAQAAWARTVGTKGSRRDDVLMAEARVRAAQARLDAAEGALDRTVLVAPTDGEVLRVKARVGEYHNPAAGDPLVILGNTDRLRVRLDIDERDVAKVKVDVPVYVTAAAFGGDHFPGKVVEIARHMGRRNVRVDDPVDRVDVKILEVLVELDGHPPLISGLRVEGFVGPLP